MLYSSLVVAVSALAGFAAAQNNTVIPCCTVPVNNVPQSERQDWCAAQQNTCVDLCGGQRNVASNGNTCDATTLDFACNCSNGTDISSAMSEYEQTVPSQMCYFWYDACVNATFGANGEGNLEQQFNCETARNNTCGTIKIDESSSSSSASPSATRSSTGGATGGASASPTASGTAAASSGAAIANFALGTPALAGGLLAVFGFAL